MANYLYVPYPQEKFNNTVKGEKFIPYRSGMQNLKKDDYLIILMKAADGMVSAVEAKVLTVPPAINITLSLNTRVSLQVVSDKTQSVSIAVIAEILSDKVWGKKLPHGLKLIPSNIYRRILQTFNKIEIEPMKKYFLYVQPLSDKPLPASIFEGSLSSRTTLNADPSPAGVEQDSKFLILYPLSGLYHAVLPGVAKVVSLNRQAKSLTVEKEVKYSREVPVNEVLELVKGTISPGFKQLSEKEFQTLTAKMQAAETPERAAPEVKPEPPLPPAPPPAPLPIKEKTLLKYVKNYIAAKGYYFTDETIYNYHICLKTRPFVILAGLSGTGKSKLSELYARALGYDTQNNCYLRLAVRPSWNDDRYLLGYLNTITDKYVSVPALDFVRQASVKKDNIYFLCLDEMNLAHVEYYFSQFLSAMEETDEADRRIPLISPSDRQRLSEETGAQSVMEPYLQLPPNLLFTGTINVDETTQQLSDKVIDRANTIEFFEVELDKIPADQPMPGAIQPVTAQVWGSYIIKKPDTSYRPLIIEIGKLLNKAGMGLGYRILNDIELYLANSAGLLQPVDAFDLQVKQRILPRVRGSDTQELQDLLQDLIDFTVRNKLPRSRQRLEEMQTRLKRDGYTSFWR